MDPAPRFEAPQYRGAAKLDGKVALITGGDSGIGRAVATLFAREGADVAFVHLLSEREDAEATTTAVETEGSQALPIAGDVRDFEFCRAAVERTVGKFGRLDILVNNAAYQRHRSSIEELSLAQWDETFKTNIYGYFHMVKAALPYLTRGSAIINTGSITGLEGSQELLDYSATKGAIHAFTKSLAQILVDRGSRCARRSPWRALRICRVPSRSA
jgi:NAD(P)-dependent dehydrogenase (short-subunit alcohol dehydrogenase family)